MHTNCSGPTEVAYCDGAPLVRRQLQLPIPALEDDIAPMWWPQDGANRLCSVLLGEVPPGPGLQSSWELLNPVVRRPFETPAALWQGTIHATRAHGRSMGSLRENFRSSSGGTHHSCHMSGRRMRLLKENITLVTHSNKLAWGRSQVGDRGQVAVGESEAA